MRTEQWRDGGVRSHVDADLTKQTCDNEAMSAGLGTSLIHSVEVASKGGDTKSATPDLLLFSASQLPITRRIDAPYMLSNCRGYASIYAIINRLGDHIYQGWLSSLVDRSS